MSMYHFSVVHPCVVWCTRRHTHIHTHIHTHTHRHTHTDTHTNTLTYLNNGQYSLLLQRAALDTGGSALLPSNPWAICHKLGKYGLFTTPPAACVCVCVC